MKFRMIVTDERGKEWSEDEDRVAIESLEEAEVWAKETVKRFNDTLRPHETPRKIVRVELPPDGDTESDVHDWEKTNIMTIMNRYFGSHDTMKCRSCGITGKRLGLSPHVQIDYDFKADGFLSCKRAKVLLERRAKRRRKADVDSLAAVAAVAAVAADDNEADKDWRDDVAFLHLTSFSGILSFASHYYATIKFQKNDYDVVHRLSRREAADMNKSDGKKADSTLSWSPGDMLSRYTSKDDAILHAKRQWRKLVPDAKVLILGSPVYGQPQPVLDGLTPEAVNKLNALYQQCEDLGWWDEGNNKQVEAVWIEWKDVLKKAGGDG